MKTILGQILGKDTKKPTKTVSKHQADDVLVSQDIFDLGHLPPQTIATKQLTLEKASSAIRRIPFIAGILPEHNGYWAHKMFPFTSIDYDVLPLEVWQTDDVCISGVDGGLILSDGTFERTLMEHAPIGSPGSKFAREGAGLRLLESPKYRLEGEYFLGFNGGHTNYAHWLTDHLLILWVFASRPEFRGQKLLLPGKALAFVRPTLKLIGITDEQVLWLSDEFIEFEKVNFLSYISFGNIPKSYRLAVDALRSGIPVFSDGLDVVKYPIYISRRDASARKLLNETELEQRLRATGVTIVIPGDLTFEKQIETFSQASLIVGLHGAGLANIIFAAPETPVIEIFPEYNLQPHYWTQASMCGLDFGFISGTSFELNNSAHDANRNWESPFVVDVDFVIDTVLKKLKTLS